MCVIEAQNLTKVFKGFRKSFTAVDSISFRVEKGEVFGFLGPNAAGKTTTIRMISGLSRPTSGRVSVCGYDSILDNVKAKKHIGLIPETPGFYGEMKGIDLLCFYAEFYSLSDRRKKAKELMERIGLDDFTDKKVKTYSHGMKKRLALASSLINDPEILILDEPSTGLDPKGISLFRKLVKDLNNEGVTVFLSSHILSEVEQMCDRVCILNKGKIIAVDSIENLSKKIGMKTQMNVFIDAEGITDNVLDVVRKMSDVLRVEKTGTGINVVCSRNVSPAVNEILVRNRVKVSSIRVTEPSLEEIFLKLTGEQNES
ncbi:MAG: ABC transporter ATP-binding protein [Euryarchaeota archaeon CG_4_9_14_3_um_filter_38_12]|nr:MAG: ABC transporter ATP-binding protein [Euryarchaeota archaeon CG_4_9_14_3_um_filter_38_12]